MNKKMTHFKQATALTVVITLVLCQSFVTGTPLTQVVSKLQRYMSGAGTVAPTRSAVKLPRAAQLSVHGAVTLNGLSASNGTTVFSGGGVRTGENSTAILSFGKMGQVELTSASDFTLAVEGATLGGQLRAGQATIVAPTGVAVKIVTADGPIVADGREAVVMTVDVTSGKTRVETSGNIANARTPASINLSPQDKIAQAEAIRKTANQLSERAGKLLDAARREKDIIRASCIDDKLMEIKAHARAVEDRIIGLRDATSSQDVDRSNHEFTILTVLSQKLDVLDTEMSQCMVDVRPFETQVKVTDTPLEELLAITGGIVGGAIAGAETGNNGTQTLSPMQ